MRLTDEDRLKVEYLKGFHDGELRNKHLKPWSFYPFTHKNIERGSLRMLKLAMGELSKQGREFALSQFTLVEIFQELHRRAQDDVEEDEEIDWEDELSQLHYQKLAKLFPQFFERREVN